MRTSITIVILWTLASCSHRATDPSTQTIEGLWKLSEIQTSVTTIAAAPGAYTAEFRTDGTLSVGADCNRCTGGYTADGSALAVGPLACTRAYCGPESLFDSFVGALDGAATYRISGSTLLVSFDSGTLLFEPIQ